MAISCTARDLPRMTPLKLRGFVDLGALAFFLAMACRESRVEN
ncbi:MAG: hypothetical protein QF805_09920 [Pirellulaceae bacterium]|nr:hypothetical protein [Pirellulaceae bacterium]